VRDHHLQDRPSVLGYEESHLSRGYARDLGCGPHYVVKDVLILLLEQAEVIHRTNVAGPGHGPAPIVEHYHELPLLLAPRVGARGIPKRARELEQVGN
jgi:hypothetical protein